MKRPLRPEEHRLWSVVASTVRPLPGRAPAPEPALPPEAVAPQASGPQAPPKSARPKGPPPSPPKPAPPAWRPPEAIEPNRRHRITRERDPIVARIDLHGMDYDQARAALESFLFRAWDEGHRAVLVITGKGARGDGVLRRAAPEWLAAPRLRPLVAGLSEAHRRHGGSGALYVALKRKPRDGSPAGRV